MAPSVIISASFPRAWDDLQFIVIFPLLSSLAKAIQGLMNEQRVEPRSPVPKFSMLEEFSRVVAWGSQWDDSPGRKILRDAKFCAPKKLAAPHPGRECRCPHRRQGSASFGTLQPAPERDIPKPTSQENATGILFRDRMLPAFGWTQYVPCPWC